MMAIAWSKNALHDLENIRTYIAIDSTVYADRQIAKLIQSTETAASFPLSGRRVPEAQDDGVRELLVGNYRVIYRVEEHQISIVTVVHAGRDLTQAEAKPWEVT